MIDKHPEDPEIAVTALEAGFREYASEFFKLTYDQQAEVAADTPLVTVKNIPYISEADQEKLTEDYIAHLKNDVMPGVLKSVENYMIKKAEQQQLQAMGEVKDYYNSTINIKITENIPEGGESAFVGYKLRFAPLNDTAVIRDWTGKWGGETIKTSATLMGFMTAGLPHTVEFFAPDADMNTAEPEFVVPFVISIPDISIEFGGTLSAKDICGTYRLQGSKVWNDHDGNHEENISYTLTVSKADGDNMNLNFDAGSYVAPYDEKTQTASYYTDDGDGGSVKFELKNGKVYANFKMHIALRSLLDGEVIDVYIFDTTASGAKEE